MDAYLARRGGYGCQRLLPAIGSWKMAPSGKPIIGFSDLTALHLSRYKETGEGGWHAPMADALPGLSPGDLKAALAGLAGLAPRRWLFPEGSAISPSGPSIGRGPLLGGNLSIVCALLGTGRLPSFDGAILMLEDVGESGYRLDRLLSSLALSSAFSRLQGLVFGQFCGCGPKSLAALQKEAARRLPRGIPAATSAPFGHQRPNLPWWVGEEAELTTNGEGSAELRFLGR